MKVKQPKNENFNAVTIDDQPIKRNTLTFVEAWSEVFECAISKDKLYAEVRAGRLPHTKIGAKILFLRDTLEAWFEKQESNSFRQPSSH